MLCENRVPGCFVQYLVHAGYIRPYSFQKSEVSRSIMDKFTLRVEKESWPLQKPFVISRGSKTTAEVVTVTLCRGGHVGRGECVPYARYGESPAGVVAQIEAERARLEAGMARASLQAEMPAGAARNAIDCALWDLEAKEKCTPVAQSLGISVQNPLYSVQTISVGSPAKMQADAAEISRFPTIKVKLDGVQMIERIAAVNRGAPNAQLVIDANESWSLDILSAHADELQKMNVAMIEQPLKAGDDHALAAYSGPVPLGADESCHTAADLDRLKGLYAYINIKLDKAGGLTEALGMQAKAREMGFGIMVGSMVSTSLALAPAVLLAAGADFVDLDSANLLALDRPHGLTLKNGRLSPPNERLWGGAQ